MASTFSEAYAESGILGAVIHAVGFVVTLVVSVFAFIASCLT